MTAKYVKLVLLALSMLFLSSCVTYKRCSDKFNWHSDTIKTVVYRDTIIPVFIKGTDTVFAYSTVRDTLIVHSGTAHAQVYVVHDTIHANVFSTDTVIQVRLDSALKVITVNNTQIVTIKERAKFTQVVNKILAGLLIIFAIVAVIIIVPRVLKKK